MSDATGVLQSSEDGDSQASAALIEAALAKPTAAERAAFLDGVCQGRPGLRVRLEILLEGRFQAEGILTQASESEAKPAVIAVAGEVSSTAVIGRYTLLERIGEGGMGEVWMAEQEKPVHRHVALKLIKVGMNTPIVVARFEAEGQALALMDHPNIARIFDAGVTGLGESQISNLKSQIPGGRPYLVMELVRGIKITEYCDQNQLPTRDRLALFIEVCQAIQHAHQKGIIHRDLKPSNILVTVNDGVPVPKVIDFGIAKAIAQKLTDKTLFTEFQALVGTPAYMSPEQADLSSVDIDTRADIYSLGVLLYELLVGRTPFDGVELIRSGLDAMRQTIREKAPLKPSRKLKTLPTADLTTTAQHRRANPLKLSHQLRGDLDWVVMKCLEKDRARRYDTATSLAMDIQRHLGNKPVVARPPSTVYRIQKLVRRNKLAFTATALFALVLAAGIGSVIVLQHRANQEYRQRYYAYQMGRAGAALAAGQFDHLGGALAQCPPEHRHWEWEYLSTQVVRWSLHTVFKIDRPIRRLLMSLDGSLVTLLATEGSGQNGTIQVHRFPSGQRVSALDMPTSPWAPLAFSPDGGMLAGRPNKDPRVVQVWNSRTGALLQAFPRDGEVECLAFSPDGRLLAAGGNASGVSCWELATGAPRQPGIAASNATALAFSPEGHALAVGTDKGAIHFVDLASGKPSLHYHAGEGEIRSLTFSPDGTTLLSSVYRSDFQRGRLKLWNLANGSSKDLGEGGIVGNHFSPDGRWILSRGGSLWDSTSGEALGRLRLHEDYGTATGFHLHGAIVSGGPDGAVTLATLSRPAMEQLRGHHASLRVLRFSPDGRTLASAGLERAVRLWDVATAREWKTYTGHRSPVAAVAWSPDGRSVVSASSDRELHCWDPATLQLRWTNSLDVMAAQAAWWLQFRPDGDRLLSSSSDGVVGFWNPVTGANLGRMAATNFFEAMDGAAWSPDGARIAGLFKDRVVMWKGDGWQEQWSVPTSADRCVRFSRDGQWLVHGNTDGSIHLRHSRDGRLIRSFERHQAAVKSVVLSPDGRRLFSGGADGIVRVWDTRTGDELLALNVTGNPLVWSIDLSPDGRTLAAADSDAVVTLWKTESPILRRSQLPQRAVAAQVDRPARDGGRAEDGLAQSELADNGAFGR